MGWAGWVTGGACVECVGCEGAGCWVGGCGRLLATEGRAPKPGFVLHLSICIAVKAACLTEFSAAAFGPRGGEPVNF
jgi:hypothetical protein